MPQVTVFVRNEDLKKWKAVEKKSEFIHKALFAMNDSKILRTPKLHKQFDIATKPIPDILANDGKLRPAINEEALVPPGSITLEPLVKVSERFSGPTCKIHGLPLDERGRCLQKGCKYA